MKSKTSKSGFLPTSNGLYRLNPIVSVPCISIYLSVKQPSYAIYFTRLCKYIAFVKTTGNFWERAWCNHDILQLLSVIIKIIVLLHVRKGRRKDAH